MRDRLLYIAYALVTASLSVATAHGWLNAGDAAQVAGVLTAAAVAYHIPDARSAAALAAAKAPAKEVAVKPDEMTWDAKPKG